MTQEMNVNQKAVQFLIGVACRRETTYYEALAIECGLPTQGNALSTAVTKLLTEVFHWCDRKGLPPLTALVVRKSGKHKGTHGLGFWKLVDEADLITRLGVPYGASNLNDFDRTVIGNFMILLCWNYFSDLQPAGNVTETRAFSGTPQEFTKAVGDSQYDLGAIFKILESIPGFHNLPPRTRENLQRGQSITSAETLHDRVTEIIERNTSAAFAWNHVLCGK